MRSEAYMLLIAVSQALPRRDRPETVAHAMANLQDALGRQQLGREAGDMPQLAHDECEAVLRLWLDHCRERGIENSKLRDLFNSNIRHAAASSHQELHS